MTPRSISVAAPIAFCHGAALLASGIFLASLEYPTSLGSNTVESESYSLSAVASGFSVLFLWYAVPGIILAGLLGFSASKALRRFAPEPPQMGDVFLWCTTVPFLLLLAGSMLAPSNSFLIFLQATGFGFGFLSSAILGLVGAWDRS